MVMALEVTILVLESGIMTEGMMYMKVRMLNFLPLRALVFLFGGRIQLHYQHGPPQGRAGTEPHSALLCEFLPRVAPNEANLGWAAEGSSLQKHWIEWFKNK